MAEKAREEEIPKGFELLRTFREHTGQTSGIVFSPDGTLSASAFDEYSAKLWEVEGGRMIARLDGYMRVARGAAFASHGRLLASAAWNGGVRVWDVAKERELLRLGEHEFAYGGLAFSPSGALLAAGSWNGTVQIWQLHTGQTTASIDARQSPVHCVALSPDEALLASASGDCGIQVWRLGDGQEIARLEGHTDCVQSMAFSFDGRLLATKSSDGTVYVWRCDAWSAVAVLNEPAPGGCPSGLAFHPRSLILATLAEMPAIVRLWDLDADVLLGAVPAVESVRCAVAKIVLVGETGVGKSGLGWRLAHDEFVEQKATHGQRFLLLNSLNAKRRDGTECEAVLWDLAGQRDYRLVHGLFLDDADLALVLANPANEQEPLHGVDFWLKSLARRSGQSCRTILVGARCDVGDAALTSWEIESFCCERGISGGYVRTSALTREGVEELLERMKAEISWDNMPATVTTATFKRIKEHVLELKASPEKAGILPSWTRLRERLEGQDAQWRFSDKQMKTAVGHLAKHGYIRVLRTSTGEERVLLVPELLNNLAASFILEARRNPKGLGSLDEQRLRSNDHLLQEAEGLSDEERDILLDAVTVLFVEHNIAFRETHGGASYLIFPELINLRKPGLGDVQTWDGVSYTVSGAVENVYAALVVLLGYTNIFTRTDQWQNQAQYQVGEGEVCGFRQIGERDGELDLVLYYCERVTPTHRLAFQGLFESFLSRRDVTVTRFAPVTCPSLSCGYQQERAEVVRRTREGRGFVCCSDCGRRIRIPKAGEKIVYRSADRRLVEQEHAAAGLRTRFETALAQVLAYLRGHDVKSRGQSCFISYASGNTEHERWVERRLARDLQNAGITVVLDRWHNQEIGGDLPRFVSRIADCSDIVVVGTPLYRRKFENRSSRAGSVVAAEVDLINQRLIGTEEQKGTVRPVLLAGNAKMSLPPLLRGKVWGSFLREQDYFATLFDLILSLYGISFDSQAVADLRETLRADPTEERAPKSSVTH